MEHKCKGGMPTERCCSTNMEWGENACDICKEFANPMTKKISDSVTRFLSSISTEEFEQLKRFLKEG